MTGGALGGGHGMGAGTPMSSGMCFSGNRNSGRREIKIEGILKKISKVETRVESAEYKKYNVTLSTEIIIDSKGREHKVNFIGLVFPDSLNHNVYYYAYHDGPYYPLVQTLIDKDIDRKYSGIHYGYEL